MASSYSSAFYQNFAIQNTNFVRNGDVSANIAWLVTCISNGFQETFSIVYTIPSPGMTDQQVKDGAFESISYQILPWSNRALVQPPLTLGATGTYALGNLYVDGSTNRVGVGTTNPSDTLQVQGDCNIQGTAYKIGGANVLTATTLGSSITSSSLTSLGTLSSPMNLSSGQAYRINNQDVLSATSLGSGVTGSSLTTVGTLSSLSTNGNVEFYRQGTTTTNFQYNATSNAMTFGAGNTGGHFQVIGTFAQGVTATTGQNGNAKLAYRNTGRFVEIGADTANTSYIDFHSNDSTDVDYDTRIISTSGSASDGGGVLTVLANSSKFPGSPFNGGVNTSGVVNIGCYVNYEPVANGNTFNRRGYDVCKRVYSGNLLKNNGSGTYTLSFYGDGNYGLYGIYTIYHMNKAGGYHNNQYAVMRGSSSSPGNTLTVTWVPIAGVQASGSGGINMSTGNNNWLPQVSFSNTSSYDSYFIVKIDVFTTDTVSSNAP